MIEIWATDLVLNEEALHCTELVDDAAGFLYKNGGDAQVVNQVLIVDLLRLQSNPPNPVYVRLMRCHCSSASSPSIVVKPWTTRWIIHVVNTVFMISGGMTVSRCPIGFKLSGPASSSQTECYVTFDKLWMERGQPLGFLAASPPCVFNPRTLTAFPLALGRSVFSRSCLDS